MTKRIEWGLLPVHPVAFDGEARPPCPGRRLTLDSMSMDHFAHVPACHSSFNVGSLYVVDYDYGNFRKPFLVQLLHKLDNASLPGEPEDEPGRTFSGPSMVICPLEGNNHDYVIDPTTGGIFLHAAKEEYEADPQLEIDILLRAEQIVKREDLYYLVRVLMRAFTRVDSPDFYVRLLDFDAIVDSDLKDKILGPYYFMYNLASLVLNTNMELWAAFWAAPMPLRWDFITEQLARAYNALPNAIADYKEEVTKADIKPAKEPRASKPKPKPEPAKQELTPHEIAMTLPISEIDRKKLMYEIKKYETAQGQDKNNLGDWIYQVTNFPWGKSTAHPIDFSTLRTEMDATHYGLPDIKDSLLEHMVIEAIAGKKVGGVLCFTGPAGTGKTSIAKTLARVSGRKCFSLPLGGVTDEAEIRG